MRLVNARLCLDCEEVHEDQHCPICGSESFAFMTRWVTPSDTVGSDASQRQPRPSDQAPHDQTERRQQLERREQVDAYRQILNPGSTPARRGRMVAGGAMGLALLGLARLVWRSAPEPGSARDGDREAAGSRSRASRPAPTPESRPDSKADSRSNSRPDLRPELRPDSRPDSRKDAQ